MGIKDQMQGKLKPMNAEDTAEVVARGEADMVVVVATRLVGVAGLDVVGPIPEELQTKIGFAAGLSASAKQPEAAKALIKFLSSAVGRADTQGQWRRTDVKLESFAVVARCPCLQAVHRRTRLLAQRQHHRVVGQDIVGQHQRRDRRQPGVRFRRRRQRRNGEREAQIAGQNQPAVLVACIHHKRAPRLFCYRRSVSQVSCGSVLPLVAIAAFAFSVC